MEQHEIAVRGGQVVPGVGGKLGANRDHIQVLGALVSPAVFHMEAAVLEHLHEVGVPKPVLVVAGGVPLAPLSVGEAVEVPSRDRTVEGCVVVVVVDDEAHHPVWFQDATALRENGSNVGAWDMFEGRGGVDEIYGRIAEAGASCVGWRPVLDAVACEVREGGELGPVARPELRKRVDGMVDPLDIRMGREVDGYHLVGSCLAQQQGGDQGCPGAELKRDAASKVSDVELVVLHHFLGNLREIASSNFLLEPSVQGSSWQAVEHVECDGFDSPVHGCSRGRWFGDST